jgi:hypothetical protein
MDQPLTPEPDMEMTSKVVWLVKICCIVVFTGLFLSKVCDSYARMQKVGVTAVSFRKNVK